MEKELENNYTEKFNKPDLPCELKYGKRIKELRKANKMTHKELAEKIGIAPRTLQMWESGKNFSFISKISKLADIFGLSIIDFFDISESKGMNKNKESGGCKKATIPKFVADFITEQKKLGHTLSYSIDACMSDRVAEWYWDNSELFAQAWVNGYEVDEEKRYIVSLKNGQPLVKSQLISVLYFSQNLKAGNYKVTHKELEEAGFEEVFNSPLFEVEEVEE